MYAAAQRMIAAESASKKTVVLHLGDHDPSGIDMTRDIQDRLYDIFCSEAEVKRIALTMSQIKKYNPPPNPAKMSDTRAREYIAEYGTESWELDALPPKVIHTLIKDTVDEYTDKEKRQVRLDEQVEHKKRLAYVSEHWGDKNVDA